MPNVPATREPGRVFLARERALSVAVLRSQHPADRFGLDEVLVSRTPRLAALLASDPTAEVDR